MSQHEVEKRLLLRIELGMNEHSRTGCSFFMGHGGQRVCDVSQHVEQVALVGVDDPLYFGQLIMAKTLGFHGFQQLCASIRGAPDGSQFGFVLEELWQLSEQHFHELLR